MGRRKIMRLQLQQRDIQILTFLWRWKIATTAALTSKRFFGNASIITGYGRLLQLKHAGLIETQDNKQQYAWTLTPHGFELIRNALPALKEEGFRSENFEHDLILMAFHLGEWLLDMPDCVRLITEQDLRRTEPEMLPTWMPRLELHRPDGYTCIVKNGHVTSVAIEVELSRKLKSHYVNLADCYSALNTIHRVLWLVPHLSDIQRIESAVREVGFDVRNMHNFVLLEGFKKQGWHTAIKSGPDQNLTVYDFFQDLVQEPAKNSPRTFLTLKLLNSQKSFPRSIRYEKAFSTKKALLTTDIPVPNYSLSTSTSNSLHTSHSSSI